MGLAGILFGLVLLIWLAFRGWSVLLLAPAAALLAFGPKIKARLADVGGTVLPGSWTEFGSLLPTKPRNGAR
jgi:hypothetical protein